MTATTRQASDVLIVGVRFFKLTILLQEYARAFAEKDGFEKRTNRALK